MLLELMLCVTRTIILFRRKKTDNLYLTQKCISSLMSKKVYKCNSLHQLIKEQSYNSISRY